MMYVSCDMEHDRHNFFLILDHFLLFYHPNNPENQNFKKMKKLPGNIIISYKCTINDNMRYEIWHVTDVIVIFHFGLFFAILPP